MGNGVDFAAVDDPRDWQRKILPNTRMLFVETPSNPLTRLADIAALADIANRHDATLVVDNCFCTPALQKPLALGAHLVIHSATKFLDGQGRCVGGAVLGDRERIAEVFAFLRAAGPCMSPFNAWVFLKGLETLELRMHRHCESAASLAQWRDRLGRVEGKAFPRGFARFEVIYRDEDVILLRGRFPLLNRIRMPNGFDAVAMVPNTAECAGPAEEGQASIVPRR